MPKITVTSRTRIFAIASGKPGFNAIESGFATNGYGAHSPGGYSMLSAFLIEVVDRIEHEGAEFQSLHLEKRDRLLEARLVIKRV